MGNICGTFPCYEHTLLSYNNSAIFWLVLMEFCVEYQVTIIYWFPMSNYVMGMRLICRFRFFVISLWGKVGVSTMLVLNGLGPQPGKRCTSCTNFYLEIMFPTLLYTLNLSSGASIYRSMCDIAKFAINREKSRNLLLSVINREILN